MNCLREMSGLDDHSLQRGPHPRWDNMEDSLAVVRYDYVRGEHEPYEGAAS